MAGLREGPANAPVTIVNFSDFQCPFCRRASDYLDRVRARHRDDVTVIYRHFPLHEFASDAAIAAECANTQGRFEELRRLMFAKRESIGIKSWSSFAAAAGVGDSAAFRVCMRSAEPRAAVVRDSLAGVALEMTGTPTFLINDLRLTGFLGDTIMDRHIERALKEASNKP